MKRIEAEQTIQALADAALLPLFTPPDFERGVTLCEALHAAGFPVIELTLRKPDSLGLFKRLAVHFDGRGPILGAGSVKDREGAAAAFEAGAAFVVSPGLAEEVMAEARGRTLPCFPGAFTASEALHAASLGAKIVKLFPAGAMGPGYLKALKGPLSHIAFMPTGGIKPDEATIKAWFGAGAVCLGLGSELIGPAQLETPDANEIGSLGRAALAAAAVSKPKYRKGTGEWVV